MKNLRGTFILLITALIWGVAFVAQSAAADSVLPFTFNAARSILAAVFLLIVTGLRSRGEKIQPENTRGTYLAGAACGVSLFIAMTLQQFGISVYPENVASSGRAGFITATYVVMVAVYAWIKNKKLRLAVLFAVVICVFGMYLLCFSGGIEGIYFGDALVLLCAIAFAVYIIIVDGCAEFDSVKVSCIQFFVTFVLSLVCALIFEKIDLSSIRAAAIPILYAGIFSSGIGYTLQIVGQKYAEPTVASIVMSLESVFSALAGWLILSESFTVREILGCALMFFAVILSQVPDFVKKKVL